ncbi:MAG TPA: DNA topoisomerase IB [Methylibium sp.]|uniref:DNA topoisomerase IB n=1 Tax=Methylibium sp. TaxID=2067992 RepID=UPI002DB8C185|nr:DNA topoisomerase IB [Methylibium sp.]HEU4459110.1 DNA topoisomerase IB [Methylibium sp.]
MPPATRLIHTDDRGPGLRRVRKGRGFAYLDPQGRALRDRAEIDRIRKLAIPPAYTQVWICPRPDGHLQATGRDARGRKQYRYHPEWRRVRDDGKFDRLVEFGRALPRIRARVATDLAATPPTRATVVATLVRLLDATFVRIGNPQYARENGSYGLTTLKPRHADVSRDAVRLHFKGKSGIEHDVRLDDPRVARIVRRCRQLPGQQLFTWRDERGEITPVGSAEVNDYIADAAGADAPRFTAKDFRTWHGSVLALELAGGTEPLTAPQIVKQVAERLRNTAAVCRKSYIHPSVLEHCARRLAQDGEAAGVERTAAPRRAAGLAAAERRLLELLSPRPRGRRAAPPACSLP